MNAEAIQKALKREGFYKGKIDGIFGPKSRQAVIDGLSKLSPPVRWQNWSEKRRRIAFMQSLFRSMDIETGIVDGYSGPQTEHAFETYEHMVRTGDKPKPWRDSIPEDDNPKPVKNNWPRQRDVNRFYGKVGTNQTKIELPFPMKLAWNKSQIIRRMTLHKKVAPSAQRVFERIAEHYSPEEIAKHGFDLFGGSLNVRKMRGGSRYSMHSWGIAIDFDPERNQLKWGRDRAYLAKPECEQFWKFWEEEGWLSLGRARNFDWMHVQAATL